VEHVVTKSFK